MDIIMRVICDSYNSKLMDVVGISYISILSATCKNEQIYEISKLYNP